MTRIIKKQFAKLSTPQASTNKAFRFQSLAQHAISSSAQKALKGGDGEGDILIEDVIGG